MRAIFISGTDTGVGKTIITSFLKRYFTETGLRVVTHKWIQSGALEDDDLATHRCLGSYDKSEDAYCCVSYKLDYPASPHLAAAMENVVIDKQKIINDFRRLEKNFDIVLVEGAGGLLVPYDQESTIADIALELKLPAILVVGNKLGAINHSLLSVNYLQSKGQPILGLIFKDLVKDIDEKIAADNVAIVEKQSKVRVIGRLAYKEKLDELYGEFKKIVEGKL